MQQAEKINLAKEAIKKANRVIVFTGAGMSADSNIATFRKSGGLWNGFFGLVALPIFGTPFGWNTMPGISWRNYITYFYEPIARSKPHLGHELLAKLEQVKEEENLERNNHKSERGERRNERDRRNHQPHVGVITMNVDGYHSIAGNSWVAEVHGTVRTNRCSSKNPDCSGQIFPLNNSSGTINEKIKELRELKCPSCNAFPRPNAVLFTESLPEAEWRKATTMVKSLEEGDVFLVIGTTGQVYPAASLPEAVIASRKIYVIEINLDSSPISEKVDCYIEGKAKDVLQSLLQDLVDQKVESTTLTVA